MSSDPRAAAASVVAARGSGGGSGVWDYHGTGLILPRGTVVVTRPADDEDLFALQDRVNAASASRGVREYALAARKVRRSAAESLALDEFCIWLNGRGFDGFFSITFSDDAVQAHGLRSVKAARNYVVRCFAEFGYFGRLALGVEMTDRDVPHVHGVMHLGADRDRLIGADSPRDGALWRYFHTACGRCRFELVRDQNETTLYALKDTFKESRSDEALYLRLRPLKGLRNADRVNTTPQEAIFATRRSKRLRAASVVLGGVA